MKNNAENSVKLAEGYIENVLSGERKAGKLEVLAVKRHISDIKTAPEKAIYFDKKAARKAFAFFSLLKHSKGEFAGHDFELSPWEAFIIYCLFGWMRTGGTRRCR